jgi:glycerol-3-phosphate dehydrogenase
MMLRLHEEQELSLSQAKHLVYLYGTECQLLIDLMKAKPHLKRPLTPELPYLAVEVVHAFEHEFCKTIEDWVIRRTQLFYSPVWPANHQQLLKTIAQLLEKEMGFSTEELKEQRESLQQRRQEFENLCRQI